MAKRISKQARKVRNIRAALIVVIVVAGLSGVVGLLRRQVTSSVMAGEDAALSATVSRGSITNVVSGSGNLTDEDVQAISLYTGVEIDEIMVETGDSVAEGDLLATVKMPTVLSAMADVQKQINDLDVSIGKASGQELSDTVSTALAGRVMVLYAEAGSDVSTVMYEKGALALVSLDGYLAVDIQTDALAAGDAVTVTDENGNSLSGTVKTVLNGTATVLVPDENAAYDASVSVASSDGTTLDTGKLYIHELMKITGIAGTVKSVSVSENQEVSANETLFTLTDTSFSANYTSLLAQRSELEEELQQLITVYQDGAVLAPISGVISGVGSDGETALSICPGTKMTVAISVDETDILSLEAGQEATVSVDALSFDAVAGTVTEIDTTAATSSGGVTVYTVTVTFDKVDGMLSGMTADVSIVIEGVDDALLIPSDALIQTSSTSYVYTTYDEETGELGGMVEVTTGLNNGSYVEITDGLSEGDTVYYFEKEDNSFGFGNMGGGRPGGMGGGDFGGGMPDFGGNGGGGMPDGFGGFGGFGG